MRLIDTHCHLYLKEFEQDIELVIQRAHDAGVERFYLPNIDSSVVPDMLELEARHPASCFVMMGLHPCSVKADFDEELSKAEHWLSKREFVAIGEIGLDFYWDKTFTGEQYTAFERQIEWALAHKIPIVIHSRDSLDECIETVKKHQNGNLRGVFHCFSGNIDQAVKITDLGFYVGIGGVVTYKNAGLAQVVEEIDMRHIVLETDAPYLTPVPYRGKRNESGYLKYVVEKIAEVKGIRVEEVAEITSRNAELLFGA